jgi:hypothetical protein
MIARISQAASKALFQLRWMFMSPQDKYAFLWARTKRHHG